MSEVLNFYNYLHTIPEEGFQEFKTSVFLAEKLESYGYDVTRNVGGETGIIGIYDSGRSGPVVALRADMDALGHIIDGILVVMMDICQCCWLRLKLLKKSN